MPKRILSVTATAASILLVAVAPGTASASQSGMTGIPWIDQYIEQVPTVSGGKVVRDVSTQRSGLSRSQIEGLAGVGGDRFAAALAAAVPPIAGSGKSHGKGGRLTPAEADVIAKAEAAGIPSVSATLIESAGGGNGGIGPILPAALIGSLIGAVALGISRVRRIGS